MSISKAVFLLTSTIIVVGYRFFYRNIQLTTRTSFLDDRNLCWSKDFGHGSIVCQCNATYCDTIPPVSKDQIKPGYYYQVYSAKNGSRFVTTQGIIIAANITVMRTLNTDKVEILINRDVKFQTIEGFGGAFTDAFGLNIASLSKPLQQTIMKQYFDEQVGLNYTFARVPMGGTDFSIRTYSYDDFTDDDDLEHFRLQTEDLVYKIPYIHWAQKFQPNLKLITSPWSAPTWMKSNHAFVGKGSLLSKYYQIWANYFLKFLESYGSHNVTFWGVTAQNEPTSGNLIDYPFNCMGWTAEQQRDWIKENLGPTLRNSNFSHVKIIMLDDDRINLANWPQTILSDSKAAEFVDGIGVHWYADAIVSVNELEETHKKFPNKWLLATEASAGFHDLEQPVILGSWERAELYAEDIISDLNHWVIGWVDWNLALNTSGGPNWANNEVDAAMIVDYKQDIVYKQPVFYAMGHFSKFIPSGSVRILSESSDFQGLSVLSCLRPDGLVVVVILNVMSEEISIQLNDKYSGLINLMITPNSIYTLIYS